MTTLFKKLNAKLPCIVYVEDAPVSFAGELAAMAAETTVFRGLPNNGAVDFLLAFCTTLAQVDTLAAKAHTLLTPDAVFWIAYPKGTSKKYTCGFNRDTGWAALGALGFEPVRQVAIDEDWTALRFRRVQFIKKMTRNFAMTDAGKKKVQQLNNQQQQG